MSKHTAPRRVVIYVRISVTSEESVSLERQIEAAEHYASQRGWTVVGTFKDDGVSASKNKPEDRKGWRELMACPEPWDAVIVWKLDRLVRRVVWFWETYQWLDLQGRSLVSVMDNLDMTTPMGRIVAGIIAGFAEMEAEAIAERVADSRKKLLRNGRLPGGKLPYGYRSIENPDGPGYVLAQDPDHIGYVRTAVERTLAGRTIYSTVQWLDEVKAPTPTGRPRWSYSTVERLLRNPILAGMVPYNPGNQSKVRGEDVVRGEDGLPVVYPDLALMPVPNWRAMVKRLDERDSAQSRPAALRTDTSGILSGLMFCGDTRHKKPVRMWRGTIQRRPGYYCPQCHHAISNFEHVVVAEFLRQKGERVRWTPVEEVAEGGEAMLPEIELRIKELQDAQNATDNDDEYDRIAEQIKGLRARRREARGMPTTVRQQWQPANMFGEDWAAATTDEEKRDILGDALHGITVRRGRPGRRSDTQLLARLEFDWRLPEDLGPVEPPTDEELADWAE